MSGGTDEKNGAEAGAATANPLSEVELPETRKRMITVEDALAGNTETPHEILKKRLTFWAIFGWVGLVILILLLLLSAGHALLLIEYTRSHNSLFDKYRDFAWTFGVCSLIFLSMFVWFLLSWKNQTLKWMGKVNKVFASKQKKQGEGKKNILTVQCERYSDTCGTNGRLYLYKMFASEFFENWLQLVNLTQTFLCMLPFGMTVVILLILICESSFRAYFVCKRLRAKSFEEQCITIEERNRFIALDIVIDLTFSSVPLAILYFGYNLKVPIANVLLLVLFPSLSLILKLNSALKGHIRYRTEEVAAAYESEMSSRFGRKRSSIFGKMWFQQIAETQNRSFPRYMKSFVVLLSVLYVLALNIVLVTQLATVSSIQCHGYIGKSTGPNYYDIGCVLKVPFCQHMLIPRCDCAAVNIVDHNMTALSDKFPRMEGLQTVTIKSGPLRHLPTNMENLAYLTTVDLSFNELQNFTVDVLQWPRLLLLDVSFNAIQTLNAAIWRHPEVNSLVLNSNAGLALPVGPNQINLPQLFLLDLGNNSMQLPALLGATQFPKMSYLFLDGNWFANGVLPKSLKSLNRLSDISIARCGLLALPSELSFWGQSRIHYLDARGNHIHNVSDAFVQLLDRNTVENYFSGNPICAGRNRGVDGINCKKICTEYCWSERSGENGDCDESCNSKDCEYDWGNCVT